MVPRLRQISCFRDCRLSVPQFTLCTKDRTSQRLHRAFFLFVGNIAQLADAAELMSDQTLGQTNLPPETSIVLVSRNTEKSSAPANPAYRGSVTEGQARIKIRAERHGELVA